ncbi:MAG: EamA family transporter [Clostridia bacterium]|nr:EamA family transporter [Clostridia bacterium]
MLYLIGAVLCSAAFSCLLRFSEPRVGNRYVLVAGNYTACSLIGLLFLLINMSFPTERVPFTILFGMLSGAMYMGTLLLLQKTISASGLVLASVFNKLGVLIPVLLALVLFSELPTAFQIAGFALAVAAILLMFLGGRHAEDAGGAKSGYARFLVWLLPVCLLLAAGTTDSMVNLFDKFGPASGKDAYLFLNFFFALLFSLIIVLVRKRKAPFRMKEYLLGMLVGVPNYFASRLVMLSLGRLPSVVVYPVYCVGTLAVITVAGIFLFREKLTVRKWVGVGIIGVALVLLNLTF